MVAPTEIPPETPPVPADTPTPRDNPVVVVGGGAGAVAVTVAEGALTWAVKPIVGAGAVIVALA